MFFCWGRRLVVMDVTTGRHHPAGAVLMNSSRTTPRAMPPRALARATSSWRVMLPRVLARANSRVNLPRAVPPRALARVTCKTKVHLSTHHAHHQRQRHHHRCHHLRHHHRIQSLQQPSLHYPHKLQRKFLNHPCSQTKLQSPPWLQKVFPATRYRLHQLNLHRTLWARVATR